MAQALKSFVLTKSNYRDWVVSGGGTKNAALMYMLEKEAESMGLWLRHSDDFGIPSQAKEAVAFALLAYQTFNGLPGNVPSATGAKTPCREKFLMFNHRGHRGARSEGPGIR